MRLQSLGDGPAGRILIDPNSSESIELLKGIAAEPIASHISEASLYEGAPALAYTISFYGSVPSVLINVVQEITLQKLDVAWRRISCKDIPYKSEFDLIHGLTGMGVCLLRINGLESLLRELLNYLVALSLDREDGRPGWWSRQGPTGPSAGWERGHANLGMAHGIAGPLCLLANTYQMGIAVPGQAAAIQRILDWLKVFMKSESGKSWWPEAVRHPGRTGGGIYAKPTRPSWCYGTPGISRAVQSASIALESPMQERLAEKALLSCLLDPNQMNLISEIQVCHGLAGVVQSAWRFGEHNYQLQDTAYELAERLQVKYASADQLRDGILSGDSGVGLVIQTVLEGSPKRWDMCLLLSD